MPNNSANNSSASLVLSITLLLVAIMSVYVGATLAKQLFPLIGAQGAVALRLGLGALILCALMRPWRARLAWGNARWLLAYGVSIGGMNLMFYMAIQYIPLGIGVALEFLGPLGLALLYSRRLLDLLWVALAATGVWMLMPHTDAAALEIKGILLALGAGFCWALYIVFGQKSGAQNGQHTVTLGMLVGALMVLPVGLHSVGTDLFALSILPIALGMAVLSAALPFSLEMYAMTRMPTRTFSILMSLEPVFGALIGLLLLHEVLSLTQWLAIATIVAASSGAAATARGSMH